MPKPTGQGIDLGQLQAQFHSMTKALDVAERALKRAQEVRDSARGQATAAEAALRDGTRTVLG